MKTSQSNENYLKFNFRSNFLNEIVLQVDIVRMEKRFLFRLKWFNSAYLYVTDSRGKKWLFYSVPFTFS